MAKVKIHVMIAIAAVVAAAAIVPGCSGGCGGKAPLAFVERDAMLVVVIPSITGTVRHSKGLMGKLQQGMLSAAMLAKPKADIRRELGFDLEKPETMKKKGIDPTRGVSIALSAADEISIVVGVADQGALDKYLRDQIGKVTRGAARYQQKSFSGVKMTLVMVGGGDRALGAWTFAKKQMLVAISKRGDPAAHLAKLVNLKTSIKDNPVFKEVRDKVGKHDVLLYVDGQGAKAALEARAARRLKTASDWAKKYIEERRKMSAAALAYFRGGGLGMRVDGDEIALRGYYAAPPQKAKMLKAIVTGTGDAPAFAKLIGPDALIVARMSLNVKKLMDKTLEMLPSNRKRRIYRKLERFERENNLNVEKDVLALLGGRYAIAFFPPKAGALTSPPRSPRQFADAAPMVLMAQVTDTKKTAELLHRLERFLVMMGLDVRPRSEGDLKIYSAEADGKETLSWTVAKNLLIVGSGGRLPATLKLLEKGGDSVLGRIGSKRGKRMLKADEGIGFNANISAIADMLRGLDLGTEVKLILAPVVSGLGKFKDINLSMQVDGDGLLAEFAVALN